MARRSRSGFVRAGTFGTTDLLILYTLTIFTSAVLLFVVQPMFARLALPLLGGTPAVWNTALVFFQAVLLAGYAYAHWSTAWLGVRRQAVLHLAVLLAPLLVLPIAMPAGWTPPTQQSPVLWLLGLMGVAVGLPFFAVSATSPLLQKWLAGTGHRAARDPYFLYAASNLGSMLALLSYPLWLEPQLRLMEQSRFWMWGYVLLVMLLAGCAVRLWLSPAASSDATESLDTEITPRPEAEPVTARRRLRWVLLSFVPSSLMLSVTTFLSTDIAAIPLLWVIPLSLYLLTFIIVFANRAVWRQHFVRRLMPIAILPVVVVLTINLAHPVGLLVPFHLLGFFVMALACHGALAEERPAPLHLTEFYLWMSLGGVLGGIFCALIAPLVFKSVVEYPLTIVLGCLLGLQPGPKSQIPNPKSEIPNSRHRVQHMLDFALPLGVLLATAVLVMILRARDWNYNDKALALAFSLPALACLFFARRPLRFALGIGAVLLSTLFLEERSSQRVLHADRSFFGVHRVVADAEGHRHDLIHGNILHGQQSFEPGRRHEPLTYYFRTGPIGRAFAALDKTWRRPIAVVGLGAGAMACYGKAGRRMDFYEIDPNIERIARDPRLFTHLRDSRGAVRVILGDARLSLKAAPNGEYSMIALDAYSSDAIPIHLITREAMRLYLDKLEPHGILAFHISNRYFNLEPVVANLARDAGLVCLSWKDYEVSEAEENLGKSHSHWVLVARRKTDFGKLAADKRWKAGRINPQAGVWTDDFSSVLTVFRWRQALRGD
ncbi:MAG TPA: fused MFS/spermidine synthase [Abditibacteriaceae bacterium]|nr:fused MFS/spermidine synthase [Abditibacteriaceae bacterium]